jgi:hypothetical protein
MKSILKFAAASLALAGLAAVATPAVAGPGRVDVVVGNGYNAAPVYVPPVSSMKLRCRYIAIVTTVLGVNMNGGSGNDANSIGASKMSGANINGASTTNGSIAVVSTMATMETGARS